MTNIQECITLLETKKNSHPHLTDMWTRYLFQKKPEKRDLILCKKAVRHMDSLPDITPEQAFIIYSMMSLFFGSTGSVLNIM